MTESLGAIIVAAGTGQRMGGLDKLFTEVAGKPLLAHAIAPFQECSLVSSIVLVLSPDNMERGRDVIKQHRFTKVSGVVAGGARRQDSVRAGLEALGACEYVAVHDGGRPLVTVDLIERGLAAARETGAAVPGVRIPDTVKEAGVDGVVARTLDRSTLWAIQTPQVFRRDILERAHRQVTADMTDDAAIVEALGEPVYVFVGDRRNMKVTVAEDFDFVARVIEGQLLDAERGLIYHMALRNDWERAEACGEYRGDTLESDGFIHCSTLQQVLPVANEWFHGRNGLLLLCIDPRKLQADLRFEASPDEEFPHIYGPVNMDAVKRVIDFSPDESGRFTLPPELAALRGAR
jgi:2-C-methyl-D-erythritol 4-phosphate cytidylyltransferase